MKRIWLSCLFVVAGCMTPATRSSGVIVSPAEAANEPWSENEKASNVVMRTLRGSPEASFHVLRVSTELGLRKHEKSDLVLVLVAGKAEVRVGERTVPSAPGDVVEIPREVPYAVINRGQDAAVLYAVYTPGFDPNDVKAVSEASGVGAWKFNLWTQ